MLLPWDLGSCVSRPTMEASRNGSELEFWGFSDLRADDACLDRIIILIITIIIIIVVTIIITIIIIAINIIAKVDSQEASQRRPFLSLHIPGRKGSSKARTVTATVKKF